MNIFIRKLNEQAKLREEIDEYIWGVFYWYIKDFKINFSNPDTWSYDMDDGSILFDGFDGCMGCYDDMSLVIKLKYFDCYDDCIAIKVASDKEEDKRQRKIEANKRWDAAEKRSILN